MKTRKVFGCEVLDSQHFEVHFCGHCPNAHLVFFDETHQPIAHATMSEGQARYVTRRIAERDPNFIE